MAIGSVPNLNNVNGVYPSGSNLKVDRRLNLDKDAFLKILITELTTQDPLDPLRDRDFIAQLAQLSQLEQIVSMNNSIGSMISSLSSAVNSMRFTMASNFIGRIVQAEGLDSTVVVKGEVYPVLVETGGKGILSYTIYDQNGNPLYRESLESNGNNVVLKPSISLPDGIYRFKVDFKPYDNSANSTAKVYGWSLVNGAMMDGNDIVLSVSGGDVKFDKIKSIK
jgi:flagellar basal-body rod modification protein FlgD